MWYIVDSSTEFVWMLNSKHQYTSGLLGFITKCCSFLQVPGNSSQPGSEAGSSGGPSSMASLFGSPVSTSPSSHVSMTTGMISIYTPESHLVMIHGYGFTVWLSHLDPSIDK